MGLNFDILINRPKLLPEFVNTEDIAKLRDTLRNHKTHKSSVFRDLVLVDTAIKTGLRRSELANLLVCHVDLNASRLIVVAGKGRKDRVILLSESLRQDLKKLTHDKRPNESVFGLNYRSLGMKIKEWSDKAGVPIHTHSFRHYFATTLVEKGANIRVVQELLGHSSLNTTPALRSVSSKRRGGGRIDGPPRSPIVARRSNLSWKTMLRQISRPKKTTPRKRQRAYKVL